MLEPGADQVEVGREGAGPDLQEVIYPMLRKVGAILMALGSTGAIWTKWPFRRVTGTTMGRGWKGLGSGNQKGSLSRTKLGMRGPGEKEGLPGTMEEASAELGTGEQGQGRERGLMVVPRVLNAGTGI